MTTNLASITKELKILNNDTLVPKTGYVMILFSNTDNIEDAFKVLLNDEETRMKFCNFYEIEEHVLRDAWLWYNNLNEIELKMLHHTIDEQLHQLRNKHLRAEKPKNKIDFSELEQKEKENGNT